MNAICSQHNLPEDKPKTLTFHCSACGREIELLTYPNDEVICFGKKVSVFKKEGTIYEPTSDRYKTHSRCRMEVKQ